MISLNLRNERKSELTVEDYCLIWGNRVAVP